MRAEPDHLDQEAWDAVCAGAHAAVQQSWAYGAAMAGHGARIVRLAVRDGPRIVAIAQLSVRRSLGVAFAACAHGPVWADVRNDAEKAAVYRTLQRAAAVRGPKLTVFAPFDAAGPAALTRVMTGRATVLVDLRRDLGTLRKGLDGKWRNRLKAAEASPIEVSSAGSEPGRYRFILDHEEAQREAKGYRALPASLVPAFQAASRDPEAVIALRADLHGRPCAGMLFLRHGAAATYQLGWADAAARRANAHNLLMWRAFEMLKTAGAEQLDLGGVDTEEGAGLARFKLGTGGAVHTPAGLYL